ncbi:helix-turn-helix transcriptional regulator [Kitasatospora sp. NPDC086791]|uniref:helix-turn-helix domain-containing protein n=1 Tax=Kitasatospora sp. NPDC086791 TaxID=3155178 RepID=UPI003433B9AB
MPAKLRFNTAALKTAATQARHVRSNGQLRLATISRHAGIDPSVLSRVTRHENGPDLATVFFLAKAYQMTVEDLLVVVGLGEAAA